MPKHRLTVQSATLEKAEQDSWTCQTCDTFVERGPYCQHCGDYWKDVASGIFEYDWEFAHD